MVIQSRIKDIIYLSDKHKHKQKTMASKIMLDEAGIPYKQFVPKQRKIVIDFDEIDYNAKKIEDGVGSLTIWVAISRNIFIICTNDIVCLIWRIT